MNSLQQAYPAVEPDPPVVPERGAIGDVPSHLRLWIVAVLGLAIDLWSKDWAIRTLKPGDAMVLIENLCSLRVSLNPGALFGIGAGLAPIFVGASVLALMFVLYLFAHSTSRRWSLHIALGLVLAGAIGNLYDRTTQSAFVVRFSKGGREIGKLVRETDATLTIGDFPDGAHPRTYSRTTIESAGIEPVVRDFVSIEAKIASHSLWPWVFNIADALLVVGVAMLLINFWSDRHGHAAPKPSADSTA
ncbi:MAG TPA: signal peptidase II [Phycisphaerae bacterium]|nr:signal peptidase II [Phycisphaerae bacterium]